MSVIIKEIVIFDWLKVATGKAGKLTTMMYKVLMNLHNTDTFITLVVVCQEHFK